MNTPKIAVCQMTSTHNPQHNFEIASRLIAQAKEQDAQLVCLPENSAFMGQNEGEAYELAEPLKGPWLARYRELARQNQIWLSLGGFPESSPEPHKYYNTHVIIDAQGNCRAAYRKIHLFSIDIPGKAVHEEGNYVAQGKELLVCESPVGNLGLSICYDLRFPEMYLELRKKGAEIMLIPAAFTQVTGQAHWEVLLRARAIETQCYVVAAAQEGEHNPKRRTYGHAMIVDPWGKMIAECQEPNSVAVATLDKAYLSQLRNQMPLFKNRP